MRKLVNSLFFPSFLRRFDEKLLLNRPWLWSTRLHRVAWPALLLALFALGLGWLIPVDQPSEIMGFVKGGLIAIVALQASLAIYWLHGQDAYNVEREHGIRRDKTGWREFGTYMAAFTLIGISAFLFTATIQQRTQTIPKDRIAYDLLLVETIHALPNQSGSSIEASLNRAIDGYLLSDFNQLEDGHHWNWNRYQFIEQYANPDDFVTLHQQWHEGNYQGLMDVVSRYAGYAVELPEEDHWETSFWQGRYNAFDNANSLFKFAFNPNSNLLLTFGAVLGAFVVHLSLLRFTFKHTGRKGLIALPVLFVGYQLTAILFLVSGSLFSNVDWLLLPAFLGVVGLFTTLFIGVYRIPNQTQFTWKTAAALYLFPLCLIAMPYLLFGMAEVAFDNWFSRHFIHSNTTSAWSAAPLGNYMLYFAQFAYVPLLGWLKRSHTRLMSLPR